MPDLAEAQFISVEEYLAGEAVAPVRHEYVGGEVFAEPVRLRHPERHARRRVGDDVWRP